MKHVRHMTRSAEAAVSPAAVVVSPLQAKFEYISGVIDVVIAFVMQKDGSTL
jgi:hypothetical protein